jgi:hypothetical protein
MRHDRDTYVTYNAANAQAGSEPENFAKLTPTTNNNYGLLYDYGSVMHYAGSAFSIKILFIKRGAVKPKILEIQTGSKTDC